MTSEDDIPLTDQDRQLAYAYAKEVLGGRPIRGRPPEFSHVASYAAAIDAGVAVPDMSTRGVLSSRARHLERLERNR